MFLSISVGVVFWLVFLLAGIEPWDHIIGWFTSLILGIVFWFVWKTKAYLYVIGFLGGEVLVNVIIFLKQTFFYDGGGANFFLPFGIFFLILFLIPTVVGVFLGFLIHFLVKKIKSYN